MTQRFSLKGQVAVVTGASRGLGLEMARAIGESGARVYMTARGVERLEQSVAELKSEGLDAVALPFDLADMKACVDAVAQVVSAEGRLDILVNNAGINAWEPLPKATVETWDRVMTTNVRATYLLCREAARAMERTGYGRIVNIGSALAVVGRENVTAYTASKHGVVGLTKAAALEYARDGIRVNAVCPGVIDTPMVQRLISGREGYEETIATRQPVGRLGLPQEIAEAVVWLSSDAASFVTGHAMAVDGGFTAQ